MRTLIDNSTITGAFRACGLAPIHDRELFDLDLASLRLLVDSLVLSQEIIILDHYKPEYSDERKRHLSGDFIRFHKLPQKLDERLAQEAVAHVRNWELGRKIATTYQGVYDQLNLLFRHAWRRSESFLVLKALGVKDKYNSPVVKGLFDLVNDAGIPPVLKEKSWTKGYNKETERVIQTIVWSAIRTVYYRQVAKVIGAEYLPHPLRNQFNLQCILFDNHPYARGLKLHSKAHIDLPPTISPPENHIAEFIKSLWDKCNEEEDNLFGVQTFDTQIPPFLGVILNRLDEYSHPKDILRLTLELRNQPESIRLRTLLCNIWSTPEGPQKVELIRELIHELADLRRRLQVYLGYDREKISLSAKIVSYSLTVPRCMIKPLYPHKPHLAFIRDVVLELASVGTMGRLVDILWNVKGRRIDS